MRSRICTTVLACALAGCVDVATLAEPPPEPTIWSEGADPARGLRYAGVLEFEDGLVISQRLAAPARPGPGEQVQASARVTGLAAGTVLWVGLRAPRLADAGDVLPAGLDQRVGRTERAALFELLREAGVEVGCELLKWM